MTAPHPHLRPAGPADAEAVALLHADSWRRHYRGAYVDAFLDGDVVADRRAVWTARLGAEPAHGVTVLAEDAAGLVGFVHVVLDHDGRWGSLVDNLHVTNDRRRGGTGTVLLGRAAAAVAERAAGPALYLWVQEQNEAARRFYRAMGGTVVETAPIEPPGGVPQWLNGAPRKLRVAWPDVRSVGR
ncbi:GNAT family N-acetyltransferase [Streptomyces longispororuber]|uniref:GNAT family N-acetyltransferase n=1 Tax=Streptomyces longispororuber TaxID=68230 RepID=UPI00210DDAD9|nr:GNAT family N-acetyltransferase [Streptomyces longispororuber]MCQ4214603.1 GNAT family N-acetyltransferase [Streptomyces longispororuber]